MVLAEYFANFGMFSMEPGWSDPQLRLLQDRPVPRKGAGRASRCSGINLEFLSTHFLWAIGCHRGSQLLDDLSVEAHPAKSGEGSKQQRDESGGLQRTAGRGSVVLHFELAQFEYGLVVRFNDGIHGTYGYIWHMSHVDSSWVDTPT